MVLTEENIKKYKRQKAMIENMPKHIPSEYDGHNIEELEKQHLEDLTIKTSKLTHEEQYAVASGINPFILIEVAKEQFYKQNEYLRKLEEQNNT